eukprot:TRINITY_DN82626_c0_g1_i1.p1 TRINITY_DN82626_c0_g1~~TRINITY_DN82626_c0_g1_i1.p1  ORF type:complete len:558 (+),score=78.32 TRINITY_DN82626_c0_g1_i1:219-1676(+)
MLFLRFGPFPVTSAMVPVVQHGFHSLFLLRLVLMMNSTTFFCFNHGRLVMRLIVGLGTLDHRRFGIWSIVFSIVNVCKHEQLSIEIPAAQMLWLFNAVHELSTNACLWFVVYTVEVFVKERLSAQLEARAFASEASGVRSLLSVLCDAEVQLSSDLRIQGSEKRLVQLLTMSSSSTSSSSLAGVNFTQYLTEADRPRFQAFLDSTLLLSASLEKNQKGELKKGDGNRDEYGSPTLPPASLHVHLRDCAGVAFAAELFHAYLHDLHGHPAHLIGICEGVGRRHMSMQEVTVSPDIHVPKAMKAPKSRSSASECSWSTVSSGSSVKSLIEVPKVLKCVTCIEISIDPLAEGLPIETCSFSFLAEDNLSAQQRVVPNMLQYLATDCREKVYDWVRHQVNGCSQSPSTRRSMLRNIVFKLPISTSCHYLKADLMLVVGESDNAAEDIGVNVASEQSSSSDDGITTTLVLNNLRPVRQKKASQLPIINES